MDTNEFFYQNGLRTLQGKVLIKNLISLVYLLIPAILIYSLHIPEVENYLDQKSYYNQTIGYRHMSSDGVYKTNSFLFYIFPWVIGFFYVFDYFKNTIIRWLIFDVDFNGDATNPDKYLVKRAGHNHSLTKLILYPHLYYTIGDKFSENKENRYGGRGWFPAILVSILFIWACNDLFSTIEIAGIISIWLIVNAFLSHLTNINLLFKLKIVSLDEAAAMPWKEGENILFLNIYIPRTVQNETEWINKRVASYIRNEQEKFREIEINNEKEKERAERLKLFSKSFT